MKKKILIVDDFENTLFVTGFTLKNVGYGVFKASSAKMAMEIIKSGQEIDLIITDFNMPEMNGLQLIQEVKAIVGNRYLPIFVLSTESKEEIKRSTLDAGASLWIRKPFNTEQLLGYIKRAIGNNEKRK